MRLAPSLAFIVAGFLAACSESNSFTTGNPFTVFADPGEFEFYSCEQLLPQRNALVTRAYCYETIFRMSKMRNVVGKLR